MKRLLFFLLVVLLACTREEADTNVYTLISLIPGPSDYPPSTRAANPDETLISDYNLFIFNSFGDLEEKVYLRGSSPFQVRLLKDVPYTILAVANMGYALPIASLEEARGFRYHLAYPDEYSRGMPMVALMENVIPGTEIPLLLERLMARIDLSIDRSELSDDTVFKVVEVRVEHCPSSARLSPGSEALDLFYSGFTKRYAEVEEVNRTGGVVSLYVLENCASGTYVVVEAEYHSGNYHTEPGDRITYRLDLDPLVRNTVYPVVLRVNNK